MIYLKTQVINMETLNDLQYEGERVPKMQAGVVDKGGSAINKKSRDALVKRVNAKEFPDISHSILQAVGQFDKDVDINTLKADEFNYLYYGVGGHFKAHKDNIKTDNPRIYTTITMIQHSEDMIGGELKVWDDQEQPHAVKLLPGETLVFHSNRLHQVTPLEQGEREVLVVWVNKRVDQIA